MRPPSLKTLLERERTHYIAQLDRVNLALGSIEKRKDKLGDAKGTTRIKKAGAGNGYTRRPRG